MSPGAGRGSGDELGLGAVARPLAALLDELRAVLAELDPAKVHDPGDLRALGRLGRA